MTEDVRDVVITISSDKLLFQASGVLPLAC